MNNETRIYFLCAPGLGILDNWLPVIHEIKQVSPLIKFTFVASKPSILTQGDDEDLTLKLANGIFDQVIFRSYGGFWLRSNSIYAARKKNSPSALKKFFIKITEKLGENSVSKLILMFLGLVEKMKNPDHQKVFPNIEEKNVTLLYDVVEEVKKYNAEVLERFNHVIKYSLCHGINVISGPPVDKMKSFPRKTDDVRAFLFSSEELAYYKNKFGLKSEALKVVGIPRHQEAWISYLLSQVQEHIDWSDFVFIISRPISEYLPYERKERVLLEIKNYLIEELKLKVVVKRHPKEKIDGLFEKVFGTENLGKTWQLSHLHPFALAQKSKFAISFYSGVPVDMIRLKVPVIEYLDLRGLKEYDHQDSLRDENAHPVFSYRFLDLVLGASNLEQLKYWANKIQNDRAAVLQKLQKRYDELFKQDLDTGSFAAKEIIHDVTNN